jgi:hypothetical protein
VLVRPANLAQPFAAFTGLARTVLAGEFVVSWAQPGPGGQMRRSGEPGHVDTDLGDDDLGGALTDPRNRRQQRRL